MSEIIPTHQESFRHLLDRVKHCRLCEAHLPLGPRPVIQAHQDARILIIGQAPGVKVHESGVPFNDASGERLRQWLGIDKDTFYNPNIVAIVPMGFCYPGRGKSGDLPPRKECAPQWHQALFDHMPNIELTLLIGQYAQKEYLPKPHPKTLTDTVKQWKTWAPQIIPLPHPSPRNNIWLKKNPWFINELVPYIQQIIDNINK
ncbi:uracil-DNA glycosylase family protein [Vibrio palustris]|uniref:Uracil DNA glycosylase superfamily protein n=1 Tax=Vibrio palustris TaxID=1918946 RepID=A0A1R4B3K3_9VIBR|nr:uracil-DNA glycosylase family protein [Vibrio palustris]SJL83498.1 Uracil DNA glycosylase superfamily protein [Vibrio palustris]